jgi:hypothetical protein
MSTVIKLKKSETALSKPSTSDLVAGEVAINALDQRIFVRDSNSKIITIGEAGGKRHESATVEHVVTVATKTSKHRYNGTGSSSGYKIDGTFSPTLELVPGNTYKFDQADSSNSGHPLRFYYEANKTTSFTTGVTTSGTPGSSGAYTQIVVSDTTPSVLHYQCSNHGFMGNQVVIGTRNLTGLDTGDLGEGSNLYYTDARFDTRLGTKDTGDLSEGSNKYYTDARVLTKINATSIDALSDVDTTTASPSSGQALVWDGSQWEPGTVGGQITVQDEGSALSTSATTINFVGSGVVASGTGATKTITIAGGSGGLSDIVNDTSPQLGGNLDLNSNNITGTGDIGLTGDITITSTDAGSSNGPALDLYRNSASPASGDYLGQVAYSGENSNGGKEIYAKVTGKITDPTHNSEDGLIETAVKGNGSFTIVSRQRSDELQLLNSVGLSVAGNTTLSGTLNTHTIPGGTGTIALTSDLYTNSDVDTHLNQSSASTNQVLSWNGSDYAWVNNAGGGGGGGNAFTNIAVSGQSTVQADASTDTLTLVGSGLNTITTNASTDTVTIGTPTGIAFVKEDGSSTSLQMSVAAGTLSSAVSSLYIPFTKEDGSSVTTLVMS